MTLPGTLTASEVIEPKPHEASVAIYPLIADVREAFRKAHAADRRQDAAPLSRLQDKW